MDISGDICAICHEDLLLNLYHLPECTHVYHTNCIMHWFRAGHNTCPLCKHHGINATSDLQWGQREAAFENYKKLRRKSLRKDAPKELKKAIAKIKHIEQKHKKLKEKFKKFKKEIPPAGKTREELDKEWNKISVKCRSWRLHRELRGAKMRLGMQHIIPLIIATKVNV